MLGFDSVLHVNSGGAATAISSTPVTVSLAGADTTAAGSTLIAAFQGGSAQSISAAPSGWVQVGPLTIGGGGRLSVFRRGPVEGLAAGESSWNFTPGSGVAGPLAWAVLEIASIDQDLPVDVVVTSGATVTSGTTVTSTAPLSSTYDGLAVTVHGSGTTTGGAAPTWGSHTGGFVEQVEGSATNGTAAGDVSVSVLPVQALGTYGATATASATLTGTMTGQAVSFVLTATGAKRAADLWLIDGAEHGSVAGAATGGVNTFRLLDTLSGDVTCTAGAARSGNFGWRLAGTSGAGAYWELAASTGSLKAGPTQLGQRAVLVRHFRLVTLPAADTVLWTLVLTDPSSTTVVLRFIAATGKLGMKVGAGTEQVSDAAVTANQWFRTGMRLDTRTASVTVDWQVSYDAVAAATVQTQATGSAAAGPTTIITYRVGQTTAGVFELHSDDAAGSGNPGHYPLGDIRVLPLKVDPAGTITVSGSTANFGVMTANGTVGAWNAANALAAIDDVPPDLSATRDALVAVTASATDYAEIPLQTYDAVGNGAAIRGVRVIACVWAAAATAATMRLQANDGTTTYTVFSEADPNADNTATPVWVQNLVRPTSTRVDWTQAKLDALVVRFGSNDATPDIGLDCVVAEVAVRKAGTLALFGNGALQAVDPDSAGIQAVTATAPAMGTGDTVLEYQESGTPTTVTVPEGTTVTEPIGAPNEPAVNRITAFWPPEPDPTA